MAEDIEEIRRQKLEELRTRAEAGDGDDSNPQSPPQPLSVAGAAELSETVTEHRIVLADFHADWCGPCQMLEPVMETIAAETDATVAKIDIDTNQQLAAEYGVRGVPTLILFVDGQPAERLVGMQNETQLRSLINQHGTAGS